LAIYQACEGNPSES